MAKIIIFGDTVMGDTTDHQPSNTVTKKLQSYFKQDKIINRSIKNATTDKALSQIDKILNQEKPDLVILNFGVNDANIERGMSAGRYNNNLNLIVEKIGVPRVILVSPSLVNWHVAVEHSWPRILQFELVTEHVANSYHLTFLNFAKVMRGTQPFTKNLEADGIHLNEQGRQLFVDHLIPLIKHKLITKK